MKTNTRFLLPFLAFGTLPLCSVAGGHLLCTNGVEIGFSIDMHRPGSAEAKSVSASEMLGCTRRCSGKTVHMVWRGHPVCGERFTVEASFTVDGDRISYSPLSFTGNASGLEVRAISYPDCKVPRGNDTGLLRPYSVGNIHYPDWKNLEPGKMVLSSSPRGFRFIAALNGEGRSYYLDQRDGARFHSAKYAMQNGHDGTSMFMRYVHDVPVSAANSASYRMPYGGVFASFRGGWYEAAMIYRRWVSTQDHYRRALARNPGRLRDIGLWMWSRGRSSLIMPDVERICKDLNVPVALDWYWWHGIPYDTGYPFFWPPRESVDDFRAAVARCRELGVWTQPYVNGTAWDCDDPSWKNGGRQGAIIRKGDIVAHEYNKFAHHRLARMCGEADAFHSEIKKVAKNISRSGFDSLYLDQIGNIGFGTCFNPEHSHETGGGDHMVRNYRAFVEGIRAENPGMQLSTEDCHESYIDVFDSSICVYGGYERFGMVMPRDEFVPVFQAVFHRCYPMYGSYATIDGLSPWDEFWPPEEKWPAEKELAWEKICPDQFAVEISRGVVWGMQPMIHNFKAARADDPRYAKDYRFLLDTARFYHANRKFLFDGEMLHPGTMDCPVQPADFIVRKIFTKCGQHKIVREPSLKRVFHSVWRAPDGEVAAVLVNWSYEAARCTLETPDGRFSGVIPARTWRCVALDGKSGSKEGGASKGVKISERFGFDPDDSTRFLQAALDSGIPEIVVDAKDGPWYTHPLTARSNQRIVFEDGAVIHAKRGGFKSRTASLLTFDGSSNVVVKGSNPETSGFRMWIKDYQDKQRYRKSEWRHAVMIRSSSDICIEGVGITRSGGDGICISTKNGPPSRNITVRNCRIDGNHRQGISVISVDGLLVEDTSLVNTRGTAPAAGIDFEPNSPRECLKNITLRRCDISGNLGTGILVAWWYFDSKTEPTSMLFEDCRIDGNKHSFSWRLGHDNIDEGCSSGSITFRNCRFSRSRQNAVHITRPINRAGSVTFENVTVENCGLKNKEEADFLVTVRGHTECDPFSYNFTNVTVKRDVKRPALAWGGKVDRYRGRPSVFTGGIRTETSGVSETVAFDDDWRRANMSYVDAVRVKPIARVSSALEGMKVVDRNPGEMSAMPVIFSRVKRERLFVFYVDDPKTVRFHMLQCVVGKRDYKTARPMDIYAFGGKEILSSQPLPEGPDGGIVEFEAKKAGFYEIFMYTRGNGIAITAANVPVALNVSECPAGFVGPPSRNPAVRKYAEERHRLYFPVGSEKRIECTFVGEAPESFGAEVFSPAGGNVWRSASIDGVERCQTPGTPGIWSIEIGAPEKGVYEDHMVTLRGVPGWLFPDKDRYWYRP